MLGDTGTDKCIRVLVLGPPGAGKTTLLERLSGSIIETIALPDVPFGISQIVDFGRRYDQYGIDRITEEITYDSIPGFVFHSADYDYGSFVRWFKELEAIRDFIVSKRLHVIWLCAMDDRNVAAYSPFSSISAGSVPILVIFTKLDERETNEQETLLGSDPHPSGISNSHPSAERDATKFVQRHEGALGRLPYPPAAFIELRNMHHDSDEGRALCDKLLQQTKAISELAHGRSNTH